MAESLAIGVDIGGTKVACALVTANGRVLASHAMSTDPEKGPDAIMDHIADEIQELLAVAGDGVAGIGIDSPGIVFPSEGVVRTAVNLGWKEVFIAREIRSRLGLDLPIWLQSDKNANALGEYYFGAAKGYKDFIYLAIGTGLGGGVIINGQIVMGAALDAGELGHLSLDPNGRLCVCGLRGCAETVVSGPGLITLTRERLARGGWSTSLTNSPDLSAATILAAARNGDELALDSVHEVGVSLGIVMAACVAIVNPALFVIGGGFGLAAFEFLEPTALVEMEKRATRARHLKQQIVPSQLSSSAVGASCLVWQGLKAQSSSITTVNLTD